MNRPTAPSGAAPPTLVLVNPWIYDFAAFDMWSKPLGLLYLASFLQLAGFRIHLIDCLDRHDSVSPARKYGTGKFRRQVVSPPAALQGMARPYSRYGIRRPAFERALASIWQPAAVLVTSLMTYWYPGVQEVIRLTRQIHPRTPIILGGIYARLCPGHAQQHSGADRVETGFTPEDVLRALKAFDVHPPGISRSGFQQVYPAFNCLRRIEYVCLLTSRGCPYRCPYCASHLLYPARSRRTAVEVAAEIAYWHRTYGVRDFAFYDDALLAAGKRHLAELLEEILRQGLSLRFHTPNALHVRGIDRPLALLMRRSGFRTLRLGLESAACAGEPRWDLKVGAGDFERAVGHLRYAGFTPREIGAYVLAGLPGQAPESVRRTVHFAAAAGAAPYLAEYSPIPGTDLWPAALRSSRWDLASEPLYHNNTLLPCWDEPELRAFRLIRQEALAIRHALRRRPG